jgi:hypothetical protein
VANSWEDELDELDDPENQEEDELESDTLSPEQEAAIEDFRKRVASFEKAETQMLVLVREFAELSKKKPDGALNKFKLKYLNQILGVLNDNLGDKRPFEDFTLFDVDAIPSNSDVKMMLGQYANQTLAFRKENTRQDSSGNYHWVLDGESIVKTVAPRLRTLGPD